MKYAIETLSLTKVFSDWWGRNKVYAVEELDLKVEYNQVYGLLGPNGSGKTTTIKMLLGLLHPTNGRALVLGGDGRDTNISAKIGFLPEESYLYKYLNARETLDFYGRLFGLPSKVRKTRTEALLDMVGLTAVANRPVGTFSKGMARRIGLAQALINDPELLILDEPTTGLDPIGTRQIKDLIVQLAKRGKTILLCSHLLADVEDVCDMIAILYGGKIQEQGKVRQLLELSEKRQITTGHLSDKALGDIEQIIRHECSEFEVDSPMEKLENYFIKTVERAQQEKAKTSGAVSTTQISSFLKNRSGSEELLDKLVSADVSVSEKQDIGANEQAEEEKTQQPQTDESMLDKLTSSDQEFTVETKQVEPEPIRQIDDVNEDVLDQLMGSGDTSEIETEDERNRGDFNDA